MKKALDIVTIDEKDYVVLQEVTHGTSTFLYLSNMQDEEDTLIRKIDKEDQDLVIPLENEKEFELACNLLFKFLVN